MFSITVFIAPNTQPLVLLYKGSDTCEANAKLLETFDTMKMGGGSNSWTSIKLVDDFGQSLKLVQEPIAVLVQDMKQAREADIERGLFQALTQIKANQRAEGEPEIAKARRQAMHGPAVHTPFGMPGMPRQ